MVLVYLGAGCVVTAAVTELGSCCAVYGLELRYSCLHFACPPKASAVFFSPGYTESSGKHFKICGRFRCTLSMEPDLFCLFCFKVHETLMDRIVKPCLKGLPDLVLVSLLSPTLYATLVLSVLLP